jgi:hypothetical protein
VAENLKKVADINLMKALLGRWMGDIDEEDWHWFRHNFHDPIPPLLI